MEEIIVKEDPPPHPLPNTFTHSKSLCSLSKVESLPWAFQTTKRVETQVQPCIVYVVCFNSAPKDSNMGYLLTI
jgi:hypothetical protein